MSKDVKLELLSKLQEGEISPEEAVSEFQKLDPTAIKTGRVYRTQSVQARVEAYRASRQMRDLVQQNRIPFISPSFYPEFYMCQGAILVGAESGRGKSTIAGNFVAGILRHCPDSRVLIISNEENPDAIYERIAACLTGKSFFAIHRKKLPPRELKQVHDYIANEVVPRVEVVPEGDWDTSIEEDVISVMEAAARDKFNAVVLDYHQNVTGSRRDPQKEAYRVSKDLGQYYKNYGKKYGIPVVVFAQLSAKAEQSKFKDRVENDKTLFNHCFIAIEAVPDFETSTTTFKIHKDRFSECTGKEVIMRYEGGRFVAEEDVV